MRRALPSIDSFVFTATGSSPSHPLLDPLLPTPYWILSQLGPAGAALHDSLLEKNLQSRLGTTTGAREVMAHAFFDGFEWEALRGEK